MTTHLTEEQIHDWLIEGSLDTEALGHLSGCAACKREVDQLRGAMAHFNDLGYIWAQKEAPRTVQVPLQPARRFSTGFGSRWSVGALYGVCLILIAVGLRILLTDTRSHSAHLAHGPAAGEIASDNRWLESMARDLQTGPDSIAISASELGAVPVRRHDRNHRGGVTPNDD